MPHLLLPARDRREPSGRRVAAGGRPARSLRRTGRTAAFAVAGVVALAGPAAAQAAAPELYGVEVDAVVDTSYTGEAHTAALEHSSSLALSTRVRASFLAVVERGAGGRILGASGEAQHTATTTGTITTREREYSSEWNDWWERATDCSGAGEARNDEGRTSLRPSPITPLVGASLVLNLADQLGVETSCTDSGRNGGAGPRSFALLSPVPADEFGPSGPLAVTFQLSAEATTAGKTIQLFEGPEVGQPVYCPDELREQPHMTSCKVTFRGTITFTRDRSGDPGRPSAGGGTARDPTPPRAPSYDDLLAPLVPVRQQAQLSGGAASVSFRAGCRAGCRGTAAIRVPARSARSAAAAANGARGRLAAQPAAARMRTLATIRVAVPKSERARAIRVVVPRRVRGALLRSSGAVVALTLTSRSGGRTMRTTLRLARPR